MALNLSCIRFDSPNSFLANATCPRTQNCHLSLSDISFKYVKYSKKFKINEQLNIIEESKEEEDERDVETSSRFLSPKRKKCYSAKSNSPEVFLSEENSVTMKKSRNS